MTSAAKPKVVAMIVASPIIMQQIDSTVITTALPQMAVSLHTDPVRLSVAVTAYLLSLAVFVPVSGWAADRFGGRTVFRAAIALFTLGSILCGLSGNVVELTAARVLQGLGGAMMVPVGRLVLFRSLEKGAAHRHDGLSAGPGADRAGARAADRRIHHDLFFLALDFPGQRSARDPRRRSGDALFRQSQGRKTAAAGLDRLCAHRRRRCSASCTASRRSAAAAANSRRWCCWPSACGWARWRCAICGAPKHPVLDLSVFRIPVFAPASAAARCFAPAPERWFFFCRCCFRCCSAFRRRFRQYHFRDRRRLDVDESDGAADHRALRVSQRSSSSTASSAPRPSQCARFSRAATPLYVIFVLLLHGRLLPVAAVHRDAGYRAMPTSDQQQMSTATSIASMAQQLSRGFGISIVAVLLHLSLAWRGAERSRSCRFHCRFRWRRRHVDELRCCSAGTCRTIPAPRSADIARS